MKKTIEINGVEFELGKDVESADVTHCGRMLYDCYDNPSQRKQAIWVNWCAWFMDLRGKFGVASYNTNFFTIQGYVEWEGESYSIYITPTHNRAFRVIG